MQEIVECFIAQGESQRHLEELKGQNQEVLLQLKGEKEALQHSFQDMKYSGEAKLSRFTADTYMMTGSAWGLVSWG